MISKKTLAWISLAIKGSTQRVGANNIEVVVREATFMPHKRHLILIQHYDREQQRIHEWSYLVPSPAFGELATRSGGRLQFSSSLLHRRPNRWTPYRLPTADVPAALRRCV